MPDYIIVAGINGAGKSTIINNLINENKSIKVVNPDVIAKDLKDIEGMAKDIKALRIADGMLKNSFKNKESLIHETTLSGSSIKNYINIAKLQGYKVEMVFISLSSTDIANRHISERVSKGGHDIPEKRVQERYPKTFKNLANVSKYIDEITILDNSNKNYEKILNITKGHIRYKNENIPEYLNETVSKVITNSRIKDYKIVKCSEKDLTKIKENNIKTIHNPYDPQKILISGKEDIKILDKILDFVRER